MTLRLWPVHSFLSTALQDRAVEEASDTGWAGSRTESAHRPSCTVFYLLSRAHRHAVIPHVRLGLVQLADLNIYLYVTVFFFFFFVPHLFSTAIKERFFAEANVPFPQRSLPLLSLLPWALPSRTLAHTFRPWLLARTEAGCGEAVLVCKDLVLW